MKNTVNKQDMKNCLVQPLCLGQMGFTEGHQQQQGLFCYHPKEPTLSPQKQCLIKSQQQGSGNITPDGCICSGGIQGCNGHLNMLGCKGFVLFYKFTVLTLLLKTFPYIQVSLF
jgi:hypothetical protein